MPPRISGSRHPASRLDVFDEAAPNPTDQNVVSGAERLRQLSNPVVVAIGGGSAMDCGKAIALLASNGGSVDALQANTDPKAGVPVIAIPITSGTGSETNGACVVTNSKLGRKTYVIHPTIIPKVALLDPELTISLPKFPTAACGFDVLTHAIEAYVSARATPYSDSVALSAIRIVAKNLPIVMHDARDMEARSQMMLASSMAAIAFNLAGLGACHGTGHALSARPDVAHGQTLATMMPHVLNFNLGVRADKYADVAFALGWGRAEASTLENARNAIHGVEQLRGDLGLNKSVRDLGGTVALLPLLVADVTADLVNRTNPEAVDAGGFEKLYQSAW